MELDKNIVNDFNSFLGIKDISKPKKRSLARYEFLDFILKQRIMTVRKYQLCSTFLAKKFSTTSKTIRSWIEKLERNKVLVCCNHNWKAGNRSKSYMFNIDILDIINKYNGFDKEFAKISKKKEIRKERWKDFDSLTYSNNNLLYVSSSYLGCWKSFTKDFTKKIQKHNLKSPREANIYQPRFMDFYVAFKYVTKNYNKINYTDYKFPTISEFRDYLSDIYGESIELDYSYIKKTWKYSPDVYSSFCSLKTAIKTHFSGKKKTERSIHIHNSLNRLQKMKVFDVTKTPNKKFVNMEQVMFKPNDVMENIITNKKESKKWKRKLYSSKFTKDGCSKVSIWESSFSCSLDTLRHL